ncbi:MAG: helix-turn-helix domain-containing protein, partial [Gammaproteobacteria bacterium]|nr:helix-turn-helix domain-containing protein [Gammaproteobacteria bacterium]
ALLLLHHFRALYANMVAPFTLHADAESRLAKYAFPGNVRELRNIVIRLAARHPGKQVQPAQLEQELEANVAGSADGGDSDQDETALQQIKAHGFRLDEMLREWEQRYINAALHLSNGNLSQAARLLGINRTTLYSRMQRHSGDRQVS